MVDWSIAYKNKKTKRKLDVDLGGQKEESTEEPLEIESFSIQNVRFSVPQFPPGLETLRDMKDDAKKEVKKAEKSIDVSKTPNIVSTSKGIVDLSGGANNEDKTMEKW